MEILSILKEQPFDVILLDLILPDSYGVDTFIRIHNENPLIPIIILIELDDEAIGSYALEKGAKDFLVKGQADVRLLDCIMQCSV